MVVYPRIEDARAVDAQEHTQTRVVDAVIDVREGVDAALRVIRHLVDDAIDDTRCAGRRSNLSGIEYT